MVRRQVSEEPQEPISKEEYEQEKERILRKAVLCETQFTILREQLRTEKLRRAKEFKEAAAAGKCPEYLAAKEAAEADRRRQSNVNKTKYELKMAQISDEFEAEMAINRTAFNDQYEYAKGRFIDFFQQLISEKKRRRQETSKIMGLLLTIPPMPDSISAAPVFEEVAYEGRETRSRSKSKKEEEERKEEERRKKDEKKEKIKNKP
ncbi:unnamed protein product [Caenorhabditis sp. 36 PRJEB53466]|nr:unnamed protein product [Caenorhabditis sp. 36 PRJEB53466]